jgi:hypothetical protein
MSALEKKLILPRSSLDTRQLASAPGQVALGNLVASSGLRRWWEVLKHWGLTHQDLLALLCLSLFLNFWGITRGLPNIDDWDPDSIAPLGPLVYAKRLLFGEMWWEEYPPFHYMLIAVISAPYIGFLWLTGGIHTPTDIYPYGLTDPETALSAFILITRSVNALMGAALTAIAYKIGKEIFERRTGFITGFLFSCCPLSVYYAHTGNLEVPYLFWSALAVLSLVILVRTPTAKYFAWLGVFTALAMGVKDQAYGLFALVPFALAVFCLQDQKQGGPRELLKHGLHGLAGFCVAYVVASNMPWNWTGWLEHISYIMGPSASRYQTYPNTLAGHFALALHTLAHLANALNIPVFLSCLAGVAYTLKNRQAFLALLVPSVSYYLTFLSVVLYVYPRFVFPLIFLVVPFAGRALSELWETKNKFARFFVTAVLVHSFAYGFFLDLQFTSDSRYQAEAWMKQNFVDGTTVGTDAQPAYLPRFPKTVKVSRVSFSNGTIHFAEGESPEYLVLSRAQYRRYRISRLTEPEQKLVALIGGSSGYEVVAAFDNALDNEPFFAPRFLPYVSPTIIILQRAASTNTVSPIPSEPTSPERAEQVQP